MGSKKKYLSPVVLFQKGKVKSQIIKSNVREVLEQFEYLFETLWAEANQQAENTRNRRRNHTRCYRNNKGSY